MTEPTKPAKKPTEGKNRFMLSFGTKYAATYNSIVQHAKDDDREPSEYVVRWLQAHYTPDGKA